VMREAAAAEFARGLAAGVAERERVMVATSATALARARLDARHAELTARARALERVRAAAEAAFERVVNDPAYHARLAPELAQALTLIPPPAGVRCRPGLEGALTGAARALGHDAKALAIRADPSCGQGFVLAATDGSVAVDATLGARLQRAWPELSIEVLRLLEVAA